MTKEKICEPPDCYGGSTHTNSNDRECCDMCGWPINAKWRWKFFVAWYYLWVGVSWDGAKRKLYILPVPCLGIVLNFGDNP